MSDATVSAANASSVIGFAVLQGADRQKLLERSRITSDRLEDGDGRIPMSEYFDLMRAAEDLTDDPAFALRYGTTVHMQEFSVLGLIFHACQTVRDAIVQANRYGRLVIDVDVGTAERFQWLRRDGGLWLVDTRPEPDDFPELTEITFGRFTRLTRPFWETPLVEEMHFTRVAPDHADQFPAMVEAPVRFETGWNAMRVNEARLTQQIAVQPRFAFGILSEHAEQLLRTLEESQTTRGRVEHLLLPILHTGDVSMDVVARTLIVSRQTLYRRLRAEGVTYEFVLDQLRYRLAVHYLSGRRTSVNEAAYLVGFSEPAAFSRAFKRWTGSTPRSVRGSDSSLVAPSG